QKEESSVFHRLSQLYKTATHPDQFSVDRVLEQVFPPSVQSRGQLALGFHLHRTRQIVRALCAPEPDGADSPQLETSARSSVVAYKIHGWRRRQSLSQLFAAVPKSRLTK